MRLCYNGKPDVVRRGTHLRECGFHLFGVRHRRIFTFVFNAGGSLRFFVYFSVFLPCLFSVFDSFFLVSVAVVCFFLLFVVTAVVFKTNDAKKSILRAARLTIFSFASEKNRQP